MGPQRELLWGEDVDMEVCERRRLLGYVDRLWAEEYGLLCIGGDKGESTEEKCDNESREVHFQVEM